MRKQKAQTSFDAKYIILGSAWRQLLKGAWPGKKYPNIRTNYKIGGKKDAIADFISLHPTNVLSVRCDTLIECSNRTPKHYDIYESLAVAEQYALYQDLKHSFLEDHQIILKTEQNSAHNIGFNHRDYPKKRKSQ